MWRKKAPGVAGALHSDLRTRSPLVPGAEFEVDAGFRCALGLLDIDVYRRKVAGERLRLGSEVVVIVLDNPVPPVGEGVFAAALIVGSTDRFLVDFYFRR